MTLGVLSQKYYYVLGKQEREERRGEERGKVRGKRKERKKRRERKEERKKGGRGGERKIFWPLSLSLQTYPPAVLTLDRSSMAGGTQEKRGITYVTHSGDGGLNFREKIPETHAL